MSLHRYAQFVVFSIFILITAGGLVTSTDSGLSVPDWPLSYGQLFPPMVGGVRFEHSHRVIAGIVGILTLILCIASFRDKRSSVHHLGLAAVGAVLLQAILGGLTVIYLLPPAISIAHACLGQTFFCLVVALAVLTSHEWKEAAVIESAEAASLRRLLILTTALVYFQLIVGAFVRHTKGAGLPYHITLAFLIVLHAVLVISRVLRDTALKEKLFKHAAFLFLLVVAQVFLGFGAFIFTQMIERTQSTQGQEFFFATAHQATGALILAMALALTLRSFRLTK